MSNHQFDDIDLNLEPVASQKASTKKNHWWRWLLVIVAVLGILAAGGALYIRGQLQPVSDQTQNQTFVVERGWTVRQIADSLLEKKLIKNPLVFRLYGQWLGKAHQIQAGAYILSPSMSVQEIYANLTPDKIQQLKITFIPGTSLNWRRNDQDPNPSVSEVLTAAGYSSDEVKKALSKQYQTPLAELLPGVSSLEGLIWADTFHFRLGISAEAVVQHSLEHMAQAIKQHDLVNLYQQRGLTLYQGIVLASIVEQEVPSKADRAQVAQVFFKRLDQGMPLQSDVTYQYASRQAGVPNNRDIDSPYNTYRYPDLPPAPIALPSLSSLLAVANPAEGEYLYFVSGDDDKNYFAKTDDEHQANIAKHCLKKCSSW